jgi:hypothetical protein
MYGMIPNYYIVLVMFYRFGEERDDTSKELVSSTPRFIHNKASKSLTAAVEKRSLKSPKHAPPKGKDQVMMHGHQPNCIFLVRHVGDLGPWILLACDRYRRQFIAGSF